MRQTPLFHITELPMKLRRLTRKEVEELALRHLGNLYQHYDDPVQEFAKALQTAIEGKNK